jgi:hypothetical protein
MKSATCGGKVLNCSRTLFFKINPLKERIVSSVNVDGREEKKEGKFD